MHTSHMQCSSTKKLHGLFQITSAGHGIGVIIVVSVIVQVSVILQKFQESMLVQGSTLVMVEDRSQFPLLAPQQYPALRVDWGMFVCLESTSTAQLDIEFHLDVSNMNLFIDNSLYTIVIANLLGTAKFSM